MLGVYVELIESQGPGFTYSEGACHRGHRLERHENEIGNRATNVSRLPKRIATFKLPTIDRKKGLKETGPENEAKEGEHARSSH